MKNNIITIMKKELARFFKDRRMVLTTVLLPGLMIYVMYSFMGEAFENMGQSEGKAYQAYAVNMPKELSVLFDSGEGSGFEIIEAEEEKQEELKQKILEGEGDILAVFPEGFAQKAASYDVKDAKEKAPDVEIYYDSTSDQSQAAFRMIRELLNSYESSLANKFDINSGGNQNDLASEEDVTGKMLSMLLPLLMLMFLFSGCMAVAPESIAGEKERGTIATLLVTPMKRSELAMGKIFALSLIALLSGMSSFLGIMLSLPKLMGNTMDTSVYQMKDIIPFLFIILSTVLVMVSLISIISAFAKTVKEASTAVAPLMILVSLLGISTMFGNGAQKDILYYMIPLYNSAQCINGIVTFSIELPFFLVTIGVNLLVTVVCIVILNRIFNSEKIMFSK